MGLSCVVAAAQKQSWLISRAHLISAKHDSSNFVLVLNGRIIYSSSLLSEAVAWLTVLHTSHLKQQDDVPGPQEDLVPIHPLCFKS